MMRMRTRRRIFGFARCPRVSFTYLSRLVSRRWRRGRGDSGLVGVVGGDGAPPRRGN